MRILSKLYLASPEGILVQFIEDKVRAPYANRKFTGGRWYLEWRKYLQTRISLEIAWHQWKFLGAGINWICSNFTRSY